MTFDLEETFSAQNHRERWDAVTVPYAERKTAYALRRQAQTREAVDAVRIHSPMFGRHVDRATVFGRSNRFGG